MNPASIIQSPIAQASHILIATHISPDADAIGSLLGLGFALRKLNKNVILLCNDDLPTNLKFLPGHSEIQKTLNKDTVFDLLITLDASDIARLGDGAKPFLESGCPILNIDHHITNTNYGSHNFIDGSAAATAEILVERIQELLVSIDTNIATCLLAGIISDTRSFATSSVTPHTLICASQLLEAGADHTHITEQVLHSRSANTLRLWGMGLVDLHLEDGIIWAAITLDDRRNNSLLDTADTGLSSMLLTAREAQIAVTFIEEVDGSVELSFRARPGFDVASVATQLGGGGHMLAAGCKVQMPLSDIVSTTIPLLKHQIAGLASQ
jgi:phosphoesterase RecJ-like protein